MQIKKKFTGLFLCGLITLSLCGCVSHIFRAPTPPPQQSESILQRLGAKLAPAPDSQKPTKATENSPVKKTVLRLAEIVWFGSIIAIAVGGFLAYSGEFWFGARIIAYSVGADIAMAYFAAHYAAIIFWGLLGVLAWEFWHRASWRNFVRKEISTIESRLTQKKT